MKEFVETLIGRLEEEKESSPCRNTQCKECKYTNQCYEGEMCYKVGIDNIKEIANQLAEEYNGYALCKTREFCDYQFLKDDGWIPCSERLPNMFDVVLAITEDDLFYVAVCNTTFRQWYDDNFEREIEVIAWMPLPQPYKENENG